MIILTGITAHSVQSVGTNEISTRHTIVEEACKAWSTVSAFVRHYKMNMYNSTDLALRRRVFIFRNTKPIQRIGTLLWEDPPICPPSQREKGPLDKYCEGSSSEERRTEVILVILLAK